MVSLAELFNENEQVLRSNLEGLQSPRDKEDLEKVINDIFNKHLSISTLMAVMPKQYADLLQSTLQLVEASLGLVVNSTTQAESQAKESDAASNEQNGGFLHRLIECLINLSLNLSSRTRTCKKQTDRHDIKNGFTVNIDGLLSGIRTICQRIDCIINIYSRSIENMTAQQKDRPSPKLHDDYGYLFNRLSDLFTSNSNGQDLKYPTGRLFRTLSNYGYEFLDYTESTQQHFEVEEIATVNKQELIAPAIFHNKKCIAIGKVFVPKSE